MPAESFEHLLERLAIVPTAPFREQWIGAVLDDLLGEIPGVECEVDDFGNRIARLRKGDAPPQGASPVFVAHLDHPGFLVSVDEDQSPQHKGPIEVIFEGRVRDSYFPNAAIRLFRSAGDSGIQARIVEAEEERNDTGYRRVSVQADGCPEGAMLGMWDVAAFEHEDGMIRGRAMDDLAGCAAILTALHRLASAERADVTAVFTRAEEAGFCGALCMLDQTPLPRLLPETPLFLSVETSGEVANHQLGDGAIIRLGDRAMTFDAEVVDRLWSLARREEIRARRVLMDRGTCEATPFATAGFRTGGLCIPVRHYHNMNSADQRIVPEEISASDGRELARLIAALGDPVRRDLPVEPNDHLDYPLFLRKGMEQLYGKTLDPHVHR